MKQCFRSLLILFIYVVFEGLNLVAYDQVNFEKAITIANKKCSPVDLRLDKAGGFWILDESNSTIQKISKEGKIEITVKPGKAKNDLFKEPVDFAFDSTGRMLVVDPGLSRIGIIEKKKLLQALPVTKPSALAVSRDDIIAVGDQSELLVRIYSKFGLPLYTLLPPANEPLASLTSMAFSRDGVLWVLDGAQGKLHRFSPDRKWLGVTPDLGKSHHVAVDEFGFAYVTLKEGRWKEINREGKVTGTFGTRGKNPGQMSNPTGIVVQSSSALWVAEQATNRLQLFKVTNSQKKEILTPQPAARVQVRPSGTWNGTFLCGFIDSQGQYVLLNSKKAALEWFDSKGKPLQSLVLTGKSKIGVQNPVWIAEDRDHHLWIADHSDHKIKRLGDKGEIVQSIGEKGRKEGQLKNPEFFCFRPDQSIVIADKDRSRVQVLSPKGLFLFSVGGAAKGNGKIRSVDGIAANQDLIALIDNSAKALNFYDSNGKFFKAIVNKEGAVPYWKEISSLALDEKGRFIVIDQGYKKLRMFDQEGQYLSEFSIEGEKTTASRDQKILVLGEKSVQAYETILSPRGIQNLSVQDASGNIQIQWTPSLEAAQYRIYRSSESEPFTSLVTVSSTQAIDSNVVPGVNYRYAVMGLNSLGYEGNWTFSEAIKASKRTDVSLVSISSTAFNPVFTAAFKYYVKNQIGTVTLKNNDSKPYHDIKLSLSLKKYTDFPTETVVKEIGAGEDKTVPVTMTFNDSVLELTENTPVEMELQIHYYENNQEKSVSQNAPLMLNSRNAISWADKMRLSSFITPRDVPVMDFSRAALKSFLDPLKSTTLPKPFARTALLYESVNALGISYVPDPKTPYSEASGKPDVLDYVQFPREMLSRRLGDCDDTTALMAALLESIGVETAIIDTPGHIFLMANTEEENFEDLGFPKERFVEYRGTYWVPLETTKFGKGFSEAWQAASAEVKSAQSKGQADIFSVLEASRNYPPVTLTEKAAPVDYPEDKIKQAFLPLLTQLQKEHYQNLVTLVKDKIKKTPDDKMLSIQLGLVHAEEGDPAEAGKVFNPLLKDGSPVVQSAANNNLGNLAYIKGDYKGALDFYKEAARLAPEDGGILINEARASWKMGDKNSAKDLLLKARKNVSDWRDWVSDMPAELIPAN